MIRALGTIFIFLVLCLPALAVNPDEVLDDPVLENRAREISSQLRCLVCQNQSIDDSDADLARDLRLIVRERLVVGDTDAEVFDFVVDRYGEFVLLQPVLAPHTLILWIAGPVLLIAGATVLFIGARRRRKDGVTLSRAERAVLQELERDVAGKDRPERG